MLGRCTTALLLGCAFLVGAEKYTGPVPPKPDIPYLLHATNLIETEVGTATEEKRKDTVVAVINGPSSPVKTPVPEPIFILKVEKLMPEKLGLYRLETRTGNREVVINHTKAKNLPKPLYLSVTKLGDRLYRIESDQILEPGEYTLSPDGSNQTFSFQVY